MSENDQKVLKFLSGKHSTIFYIWCKLQVFGLISEIINENKYIIIKLIPTFLVMFKTKNNWL